VSPETPPDSFERGLNARRKRDRTIAFVVAGVVVVGAASIAGWVLTRPPPRCDAKQLDVFLGQKQIPAAAIGEVCKLPPPLSATLARMVGMPPELGRMSIFKLLAEHHELFAPQCANLPGAVASAMAQVPSAQTSIVVKACTPAAFPFADESTLASAPLDRLLLASAVHTALVDDDAATADRVARALLDR
jgi:hypothetical protein